MDVDTTTAITAIPAGRDRHGAPLKRRAYVIDRDPEPFGNGRSRIFAENRSFPKDDGGFIFTPQVVQSDSIKQATPPTVGAMALHRSGKLDGRCVSRVSSDGLYVWLAILGMESGPYHARNYTYTVRVQSQAEYDNYEQDVAAEALL